MFNADGDSLVTEMPVSFNTDLVDLHCHSTASDGILSPEALVSRAKSRGVTLLALTDHDTVAGVADARRTGAAVGLEVLPGIEFSACWGQRQVHILGLGLDPGSAELQRAVALRASLRETRARAIAERLEKRGFAGALNGAKTLAGDGVLGRPHFARWLVERGYVADAAQAFKRYLGAGKIGDVAVEWPQMAETIASIHVAGGVAVLAHPLKYSLTRSRLKALLLDFAQAGGRGVELVCGLQNPMQTRDLARLLESLELDSPLLCSVGSDFHQPGQPWRELGRARLPEGVEPVWALLGN